MDRVRTALVGCGKVGQIHAQALAALPESDLVGVCDVDSARAASFAGALWRASVHGRRDDAATTAACRHSCIGTPHPLHAEPAVQAAEAGVHVLVEKPHGRRAWRTATPCSRRRDGAGSSWA